ncbi:MAG TPA: hypothetical protein DCR43_03050 [Bacteroidales bacterium]|nr:MAG: hypothetical protein A2X11_13670 [Bacteroidetes bacterium GWE2_42_24]OFY30129.1 MAG: hypothetical protein A2X09_14105 [Bacteroidetes bacterium GWF2_43_11]PKP17331.1 MAG: hypothetical protein CVU06_13285 [Bacteroidetes bacterium HGW-Bacteroidetes-22]HAQ64820.1 hypothetical protein [Bacteroidales bacterium]HBZ67943.1 hypothetical protein [Bacteroidales bacterium]
MHDIAPFDRWEDIYDSSSDPRSPLYGTRYHDSLCTNAVYNYYIHPYWDEMGSSTLYLKILYAGYQENFAVIELIGEWNDVLHNDIMYLKRNIAEPLIAEGINKFLIIGEHVLNFHADANDYYEEWFDEIGDGWIVGLNFRDHVVEEFSRARLDYYIAFGGGFTSFNWRRFSPEQLCKAMTIMMSRRLGI